MGGGGKTPIPESANPPGMQPESWKSVHPGCPDQGKAEIECQFMLRSRNRSGASPGRNQEFKYLKEGTTKKMGSTPPCEEEGSTNQKSLKPEEELWKRLNNDIRQGGEPRQVWG